MRGPAGEAGEPGEAAWECRGGVGQGRAPGWGRGAHAHLIPEAECGPCLLGGTENERAWEAGRPEEGALPSPWERPHGLAQSHQALWKVSDSA